MSNEEEEVVVYIPAYGTSGWEEELEYLQTLFGAEETIEEER